MIGVDIVSIARIERLVEKYGARFLERFLSQSEMDLCRNARGFNIKRIAGFFAAKEALAKALKCGIGKKLAFSDIIIAKNSNGAPFITLSARALKGFEVREIDVSISHDGDYAIATVIVT